MKINRTVDELAWVLAKTICHQGWEEIPAEIRRRLRVAAFQMTQSLNAAYVAGIDESIDILAEELDDGDMFKKDVSGMRLAVQLLRDAEVEITMEQYSLATAPDFVPDGLLSVDPYGDATAGDADPYVDAEGERCGAVHVDGWECTRTLHPTTWVHFDADPVLGQTIHAVWEHDSDHTLSVDPEACVDGDE